MVGEMADETSPTHSFPEQFIFDRPNNERRIAGALCSAIDAHGPIGKEWIGSAAKRVESTLRGAYKSQKEARGQVAAGLDARIAQLEQELAAAYRERAGRMIDERYGWCCRCGRARVDTEAGEDTCPDCL